MEGVDGGVVVELVQSGLVPLLSPVKVMYLSCAEYNTMPFSKSTCVHIVAFRVSVFPKKCTNVEERLVKLWYVPVRLSGRSREAHLEPGRVRAGGAVPAAGAAGAGVPAETAAAVRRAEPQQENTVRTRQYSLGRVQCRISLDMKPQERLLFRSQTSVALFSGFF